LENNQIFSIKNEQIINHDYEPELSLVLLGNTGDIIFQQHVNAQNVKNNSTSPTQEKSYILIFGQRTVGNIDNSTKIVSSIVGHNLVKYKKNF
jgi:hypothetical protein